MDLLSLNCRNTQSGRGHESRWRSLLKLYVLNSPDQGPSTRFFVRYLGAVKASPQWIRDHWVKFRERHSKIIDERRYHARVWYGNSCTTGHRRLFSSHHANRDITFQRHRNLLILDNASWHKSESLDWGQFEPVSMETSGPMTRTIAVADTWHAKRSPWRDPLPTTPSFSVGHLGKVADGSPRRDICRKSLCPRNQIEPINLG